MTDTSPQHGDIESIIQAWRAELDGSTSVSATEVQDHLLELWGSLPDGDRRAEVERWLTETLARQLYAVDDIDARLERVLASA